ncbi:5-methylcytosine restriction system specificity protein McrC [Marinobacter persicus]|uniref:McrBC 5-methylcytosine restriction system component n=1 Tax=Marinobacter persicus TaxID=930118 RepID=A0A2S6G1Y8_9GAMM|nr:restriction endonuclease [Marinobacter persicus]PPK49828.1 McrBC 5-methylcytosine restriction system component [Marinobacter persicus]PPK51110.1 McrBC 5-methylcytosine restriction system component [Marinobacter persicus]PPK55593.1 McrBC 5-methylcytosine restriction system component [Marinobacter persicus]
MLRSRPRFSLVENGKPVQLSDDMFLEVGLDKHKLKSLLTDAGLRAAKHLGLKNNPITIEPKGVRAAGFAGLIRLTPSLELEVAPKFLGLDDQDSIWREDFFFLCTLSKYGRFLATDKLSASSGAPRDLATLVARSIISMYEAQKRRPLRSYRKALETGFFIEGDPDPVDIVFPSPEGFEQEVIRFDRRNVWNAEIVTAAKDLLPEVREPVVASFLMRLIEDLSPQGSVSTRSKPIPSRQRAWKPLHDLAQDVIRGLGVNYKQGQSAAPGYLVTTWRVWEDLITVALRLGFGNSSVQSQASFVLGEKTSAASGKTSDILVFPDFVIQNQKNGRRFLVDAKYKGHIEKGKLRIVESDIYEALAFAKASFCNLIVLIYPARPDEPKRPLGKCETFQTLSINDVTIVGVQVEIRNISKPGGIKEFASKMYDYLSSFDL